MLPLDALLYTDLNVNKSKGELEMDVKKFLIEFFSRRVPREEIDPEADIFESGYVDSLGIFELILSLEKFLSLLLMKLNMHGNYLTCHIVVFQMNGMI